jgi:DHA1 family bicyclomycin/chloramphenicol resistance-like MFS transporter
VTATQDDAATGETDAGTPRGLFTLLAACSALGPVSTLLLIAALPSIRDEFGASTAATQAVISVFLFTFAAGIPLAGPLSDRYGRRPLLLGGLGVFIIGSVLAYFAPTLELVVVARIIQAAGCAATTTVSRAVLGDIYPDWRLARALANLTLIMMIGTSLSPYVGGLLAERAGWHAPFLLLLTLSGMIGLVALRALPETRVAHSGSMSLAAVGRASVDVLRNRAFVGCAVDAGMMYALYLGFITVAPYLLADMLGRPATDFGLYIMLLSLGYFMGNLYVSRLRGHAALERVARFGIWLQAVSACAAFGFVLAGLTDPIWWFGPMLPLAFAQGLALPHVTATAVRLAPGYAGVASGMIGFAQQTCAALAVQAMGFVPTDTPLPVLGFCATLSLVSIGAMMLLERMIRQQPASREDPSP